MNDYQMIFSQYGRLKNVAASFLGYDDVWNGRRSRAEQDGAVLWEMPWDLDEHLYRFR